MITNFIKMPMSRPLFIWHHRIGRTLDCGCNDGSLVDLGHREISSYSGQPFTFEHDNDWLYSFDIDKWILPNFTRGDAHRMPFKDNSFNTVVLGDILEHVPEPIKVLKESDRICIERIVITLPNESEWDERLDPYHIENMTIEEMENVTIRHPSIYTKCTEFVNEAKMRHLPHLRTFDYYTIYELLSNGLSKQYKIVMYNLTHPLYPANPEDPTDSPYWGIIVEKTIDISKTRFGITNMG